MPMNEEVRKAVKYCDRRAEDSPYDESDWYLVRAYLMQQDAELTRLTEIADSVDPLVVRLGEVTTRLEAANASVKLLTIGNLSYAQDNTNLLGRESVALKRLEAANALLREAECELRGSCLSRESARISQDIRTHLSEPRT